MASALIGYSGFIGGNLQAQFGFDTLYRSSNIAEIKGRSFDDLVCAGAPAVKWLANKEPEKDAAAIGFLISCLTAASARRAVLISTVDVYPQPIAVDEGTNIGGLPNHAYGTNRRRLEMAFLDHFPDATVIRLPAMFGPGLKKNAIYDLLHDNQVEAICPDSTFQFYDVRWLEADLPLARERIKGIVNFATAPLSMAEIAQEAFGLTLARRPEHKPAAYDFRSQFARIFGGKGGYLRTRDQVMGALARFAAEERAHKAQP